MGKIKGWYGGWEGVGRNGIGEKEEGIVGVEGMVVR